VPGCKVVIEEPPQGKEKEPKSDAKRSAELEFDGVATGRQPSDFDRRMELHMRMQRLKQEVIQKE